MEKKGFIKSQIRPLTTLAGVGGGRLVARDSQSEQPPPSWSGMPVGVPSEKAAHSPWGQHSQPTWGGFKVGMRKEIAQVLDCGPDVKVVKSNAFLP